MRCFISTLVLKPHLTVMDFKLPLLSNGLQASRLILKQHPSASIPDDNNFRIAAINGGSKKGRAKEDSGSKSGVDAFFGRGL